MKLSKIINIIKKKRNESKALSLVSKVVVFVCLSSIVTVGVLKTPIGRRAIKSYIMENPRDIIESLQEMDRKEKEKNEAEAKESAKDISAEIINDPSTPILGNKDAKNTVILFFDYSCSYCKHAAVEIKEVLKQRKDVRILLQDFPILSMNSLVAAKMGLYVYKKYPQKFEKFHFDLLAKPSVDEASIKDVAVGVGIPAAEAQKAMNSSEFEQQVREIYSRASKIKANGTPVFIINGKLVVGAVSAQNIMNELTE